MLGLAKATTITIVALLAGGLATQPQAEPGPIGRWLMSEPLTLWDIGMIRAEEKASRAAETSSPDLGFSRWGGARYSWENNGIELYMNVVGYEGEPTHEKCNEVRQTFIRDLVYWGDNDDALRLILTSMISNWFSHEGWQKQSRDEKIGEKMARITFVKVLLNGPKGSISCRDRILVFDAPSKPS